MSIRERIKQYLPLVLLSFLAAMVVFLGVVSAANAQQFNPRFKQDFSNNNTDGKVIAGPDAGEAQSDIFQPLAPHPQGRFTTRDDSRPTRIGRAGRLPRDTVRAPQQPQPTPNLEEMASLSDEADNASNGRLGPSDMSQARRAGDLARMAAEDDAPTPDFDELTLNNQHIRTAQVQVHLKEGQDDKQTLLSWRMNPVEYPVFIEKVQALEPAMSGSVPVTSSGTAYERTSVRLVDKEGRTYAPVSIYQNQIFLPDSRAPYQDSSRDLETWVLGTAKRHDQREIISELVQVMSYQQCKALGHTLVDGAPRQCILPDGTTFIEIDEKITPKDRQITSFEKCLKGGHPIVDTFPRKCVAPGGRVYVEPPQL